MIALREPAGRLPERSPRVGELVEVRSRRWLVEAVEDADPEAPQRVSLACADDDAQGQTLEGQRRRVETELARQEAGGIQLALEFSEDEKRQREADMISWRTRLAQFDRDLETEPARIRGFYGVRAERVEPIGLVYLWPDTG